MSCLPPLDDLDEYVRNFGFAGVLSSWEWQIKAALKSYPSFVFLLGTFKWAWRKSKYLPVVIKKIIICIYIKLALLPYFLDSKMYIFMYFYISGMGVRLHACLMWHLSVFLPFYLSPSFCKSNKQVEALIKLLSYNQGNKMIFSSSSLLSPRDTFFAY